MISFNFKMLGTVPFVVTERLSSFVAVPQQQISHDPDWEGGQLFSMQLFLSNPQPCSEFTLPLELPGKSARLSWETWKHTSLPFHVLGAII